jgi:hypothetical protein
MKMGRNKSVLVHDMRPSYGRQIAGTGRYSISAGPDRSIWAAVARNRAFRVISTAILVAYFGFFGFVMLLTVFGVVTFRYG